ncbi:MAG: (S)-ureidoglycine aminohydrolase [Planctomycetota bacterium]
MSLHPLGQTRTCVMTDHAIIGTDSHVPSPIHAWTETTGVMLISPSMGAVHKPDFAMYLVDLDASSRLETSGNGIQRVIITLEGELTVDGNPIPAQSYVYLPGQSKLTCHAAVHAKCLVFEKAFVPLPGQSPPDFRFGAIADVPAEPFLGDEDARLACLLPDDPSFDIAVNVFTYQSGAALPFVETHIMQHGLYMTAGQGVYRLADSWYPVAAGDAIWMASYCPQWFVAMGKQPAQYIYYKDVHRDHLSPIPNALK